MANFDFKTATPDTSFPANGFLFGADSQSATDPSIYSHTAYLNYILSLANTWAAKQTITPAANTNAIAVTGYSLTGTNAQSLIDLAGTWNTTGTPTALKLNITDTASNASSLLLDLQTGGTSRVSVSKGGVINCTSINGSGIGYGFLGGIGLGFNSASQLTIPSAGALNFGSSGLNSPDTFVVRDAANVCAQRNGSTAQEKRVYGTYTDASNYRRLAKGMSTAGVAFLRPEGAGTGASGNVLHISGLPTSNPGPGILWNNAGTPAIGT